MIKKEEHTRVRFAPSPTGPLHVGNVRTALFNWIFTKAHNGEFILRIEDTDKERSRKEFEDDILEGLTWLGITWDDFYKQSKRVDIHKKYLGKLLDDGWAYYCFCSKEDLEDDRQAMLSQGIAPKYSGRCRSLDKKNAEKRIKDGDNHVIRFKAKELKLSFRDLIRGEVTFDTSLIGDFVIARDIDDPLYNFAVVVDDSLTNITHVIRGEDHISNTPKQILIMNALGFKVPHFAHLPIILNPDRSKMSKRFINTSVKNYIDEGFLPQAMINFLAYLGWHPKEDKEIMSIEEIIKEFDLSRIQKGGAIFNEEKLTWLNSTYIKNLNTKDFINTAKRFIPEDWVLTKSMAESVKGRIEKLSDLEGLISFYFKLPKYESKKLQWRDTSLQDVAKHLQNAIDILDKIPKTEFEEKYLEDLFLRSIVREKRGEALWPLRVTLSGKSASPGPFEIMNVLGKEESIKRIQIGLDKIRSFDF